MLKTKDMLIDGLKFNNFLKVLRVAKFDRISTEINKKKIEAGNLNYRLVDKNITEFENNTLTTDSRYNSYL